MVAMKLARTELEAGPGACLMTYREKKLLDNNIQPFFLPQKISILNIKMGSGLHSLSVIITRQLSCRN